MKYRLCLLASALLLISAPFPLPAQAPSESSAASPPYWCLMRGKPCDVVDYDAPGQCPTCGMALVTRAAYETQMAKLRAGQKTLGVVLYRGFELLDVFGPVEMWAYVPQFHVVFVGEKAGKIHSAQGPPAFAEYSFADCPPLDIVMVPGGMGTLKEIENEAMLGFLRERCAKAEITTSVCSGSAILAKAGLLDGRKATSNKLYFSLLTKQGPKVDWVAKARWVDDGNIITSSGVSAGIDMSLHLISRLYGEDAALKIARQTEYSWSRDPANDPFAPAPK